MPKTDYNKSINKENNKNNIYFYLFSDISSRVHIDVAFN